MQLCKSVKLISPPSPASQILRIRHREIHFYVRECVCVSFYYKQIVCIASRTLTGSGFCLKFKVSARARDFILLLYLLPGIFDWKCVAAVANLFALNILKEAYIKKVNTKEADTTEPSVYFAQNNKN